MARFYITTKETTHKAADAKEVFAIMKSINVEDVMYIESYSKRWGYTDVTGKFLAK